MTDRSFDGSHKVLSKDLDQIDDGPNSKSTECKDEQEIPANWLFGIPTVGSKSPQEKPQGEQDPIIRIESTSIACVGNNFALNKRKVCINSGFHSLLLIRFFDWERGFHSSCTNDQHGQ